LANGQERLGSDHYLYLGDNYRIYPSEVSQTEVFIVKSPLDDNALFASCNTLSFIPFFISEGIYVTKDEGNSWSGNDTCTGEPIDFHGGDPGIAIDKNGTLILTRLGRTPFTGLYSHYSVDNGQNWSAQQAVSTDDLDRATLISDVDPSSSYYGRSYTAWVKLAPPFPVMFSYTDDVTQSWSVSSQVNDPDNRSAGGDITVGPDGEVFICWAGVTSVSPFKEVFVGFASSLDGGGEWNVTENAFEVNGITGILPEKENIRVNGLPGIAVDTTSGQGRGTIYIVTGQRDLSPAGSDPDIVLNRSTDGGITWSEGIRVNQDELNNGRIQLFPAVHIDKFGAVNVLFYDDRNTTPDSMGVFLARSLDRGETWKEYEVSDHNFKPVPIGGLGQGYMGDNIDITSTSTHLWPVWMDNSTGTYQAWTSPIRFSSLNTVEDRAADQSIVQLRQNFPNPFSEKTTLRFSLKNKGVVNLSVYDIHGNLVAELINGIRSAGTHKVDFIPSGATGKGIFVYKISAQDDIKAGKMLLLP
jgi:hypothetical protein